MDLTPLYQLIDDLQAQRDVIDRRLALAAELLDTYDPTDVEVTIPLEDEPVNIVTSKPAKVACPDCGQLFHHQGIGPHRARKHPSSAAKPVELRPVPAFDPDAARERAAAAI